MGASFSTALANALLGDIPTTLYAQLHTGDPGSAGTANVSSVTTRQAVTLGSPSGGSVAATNVPTWTSWAGTNGEVVTYLSLWSLSSGGTFEDSVQLTSSITVNTADTVELTSLSIAFPTAS